MGAIVSMLQLGLAYCCCNTAGSLCNTCLGSTSPGTTGRKRSVLLLAIAIAFALLFQYSIGPSILHRTGWWKVYSSIPGAGKYIYQAWTNGCEAYADDPSQSDLMEQCVSNNGVYRPTFLSTIFFLSSAAASRANPHLNRAAWPAKFGFFFLCLLATMFIPNEPLFQSIFLHLFRILAAVFIILQQVILIDVAYNWNERWVEKSDECEREEWGSGRKWLLAILFSCLALYALAFTGIGLLFHHFSHCPENVAVITSTLVGILLVSAIQLSGTDGSLLASSVISVYASYLAYSIVSKNPNATCNPTLGSNDVWGIVIGLLLTIVSLAWTGFSWTAEERLNPDRVQTTRALTPTKPVTHREEDSLNLDVPFIDPEDVPTMGVVMESGGADGTILSRGGTSLWKLNVVLALVSCWVAASLTGWGSIQGGIGEEGEHTAANPQVGRANMWMIGISQWFVLILYGWTVLAPRIFPDRDFS